MHQGCVEGMKGRGAYLEMETKRGVSLVNMLLIGENIFSRYPSPCLSQWTRGEAGIFSVDSGTEVGIRDWGKAENEKVILSTGEVLVNKCTSLLSFKAD